MTLEEIAAARVAAKLLPKCPVCRCKDRDRVDAELAKMPRSVTYQDLTTWLRTRGAGDVSARTVENHWRRQHYERYAERTRRSAKS